MSRLQEFSLASHQSSQFPHPKTAASMRKHLAEDHGHDRRDLGEAGYKTAAQLRTFHADMHQQFVVNADHTHH